MENVFRSIESRFVSVSRLQRPSIIVGGHTYQADALAVYKENLMIIYLHS